MGYPVEELSDEVSGSVTADRGEGGGHEREREREREREGGEGGGGRRGGGTVVGEMTLTSFSLSSGDSI